MKKVTLKQGNQVLNLILQKDVPREQLQELLASGLLADLLDANIQRVDRQKLREVLGLVTFKNDPSKTDWKLMEDIPFDGKRFIPKIVGFLNSNELIVGGEEMKYRAKYLKAHLGQHHAEYLLEHQDLIPKEEGVDCLLFPGTVWLGFRGRYIIMCLVREGSEWHSSFTPLIGDWDNSFRLVGVIST